MADTSCRIKDVTFIRETHAAIQICVGSKQPVWIPFSQVIKLERSPVPHQSSITMESWIAKKKGLTQ